MKKLVVILLSLGLALGASAQRGHGGGGHYYGGGHAYYSPRVYVGVGAYSPFYSPYYGYGFGFGYPFYNPFGYYPPYGSYGYRHDSRLDMQIEDIRNDFKHQIKETRHDKSIPRSERKAKIRDLKYQRDKEITNAQRNFYYNQTHRQQQPNTYRPAPQQNQPQPNQNQQQPNPNQQNQQYPNQQNQQN